VSLLTDASSEMIYPLLPAFLTGTLRAGPAFLGVVEGLAEAVAAAVKIVSGRVSDRLPRRKPLVVAGYALSSLVRPMVALAAVPGHVLAVRVLDRVGKGVRGAPRDALLAEVVPPRDRGRAFGFQRAMDHAGAMVGPLLASAALLVTSDLRVVFALAAVPAALAVATLLWGVREDPRPVGPPAGAPPLAPVWGPPRAGRSGWRRSVAHPDGCGIGQPGGVRLRAQRGTHRERVPPPPGNGRPDAWRPGADNGHAGQ
jgi:MFS family permease